MADPFKEIDEDLRAEQALRTLRRYGPLAGLCLVLALVAVGGWQALAWQHRQAEARLSASYLAATKQADDLASSGFGTDSAELAAARKKALAAFEPLEASDDATIRTLSRLRAAQLLTDAKDVPGAIHALDAVAADDHAERALRDAATLFSVQRQISTADPAALRRRLAGLEQPGGAFRTLALEAEAAVDLAHGQLADARREYQMVFADGSSPQGERERAATFLQALGAQEHAG